MTFDAAICGTDPSLLAKANGDGVMEAMQCRAARGLLQWTQNELAAHSGISDTTIRNFEKGLTTPNPATVIVLRQTLEKAGVEFIDADHPGVRMRRRPKK
jgi:DNA-binding XRE family transcriptional regulator